MPTNRDKEVAPTSRTRTSTTAAVTPRTSRTTTKATAAVSEAELPVALPEVRPAGSLTAALLAAALPESGGSAPVAPLLPIAALLLIAWSASFPAGSGRRPRSSASRFLSSSTTSRDACNTQRCAWSTITFRPYERGCRP
jgi:hypothetical protein